MSVLCYHSVDPSWSSPLAVAPEAFEQHAAWLAARRAVVPLEVAVDRMDRRGRLPRGFCALTLDDGFADNAEIALPILQKHGLPATVFLVAETLSPGGREVDWVDTPPDHPLRTLTAAQVTHMQAAGVRFGSHSWAHHDLTSLGYAECVADLRRSKELLEDLLGERVPFLAYPRGRNDVHVRRAAREAGYKAAFTLPEAREPVDAMGLPRVGVFPGNNLRTLAVKTEPAYLSVRTSSVFPWLRRRAGRLADALGAGTAGRGV